jgi:excisionase family DNA binding protein
MENPFVLIYQRLDSIECVLRELNARETKPIPRYKPDLLIIDEAVLLLNLAKSTIYNLVSCGKIPVMKKSKRLYFSRDELLDWLRSGKRKTVQEIEEEARAYMTDRPYAGSKK